jgi:hypothetical protein
MRDKPPMDKAEDEFWKELRSRNLLTPEVIPATDIDLKEFSDASFFHTAQSRKCIICGKKI